MLVGRIFKRFKRLFRSKKSLRKELCATRSDLTEPELKCILNCLDQFEAPTYLEIGVYFGGNLEKILKHLSIRKDKFRVIGIDLFEDLEGQSQDQQTHDLINKWNILNVAYLNELEEKLNGYGFKNFQLIKGYSDQIIHNLSEQVDVFFVDGNHTFKQTQNDAMACMEKSKLGSYLIFHNASNNIEPDPQYVNRDGGPWKVCEILKNDKRLNFVELIDRCAIFKVNILS